MRTLTLHKANDLRIENQDKEELSKGQVRVRLARGGICGSDLHYFNHGGFGPIQMKQPMILGHEVAGHVEEVAAGVEGLKPGDLVAVSPSRPCGQCENCQKGLQNHCANMRFYGSAMPFPHIQGAFREDLVADASQCVKADGLSAAEAAMAEPLSVVLHACKQAGDLLGKRVLITGCGPIGALCIVSARAAGAAEIIVTDLSDNALAYGTKAGADTTINMADEPDALTPFQEGKGWFDVQFECSGAPSALAAGIAALRPRGILMQLGLGGDMPVPMMQLTAKELQIRGSFRFHEEFALAVKLMQQKVIDVKPLISETFAIDDAVAAFERAGDRSKAMKVQIAFS